MRVSGVITLGRVTRHKGLAMVSAQKLGLPETDFYLCSTTRKAEVLVFHQ